MLWPRLRDEETPRRARQTYAALVDRIHADGWEVENYQFPLIADERRAGSTLLQRLMGLVDVRTDREVWMQYTSFVGSLGASLLWSYGPDSEAIAVGTTGAGRTFRGTRSSDLSVGISSSGISGWLDTGWRTSTSTASRDASGTGTSRGFDRSNGRPKPGPLGLQP